MERTLAVLAGTLIGCVGLALSVPRNLEGYVVAGSCWLLTFVYWALTRPRKPL